MAPHPSQEDARIRRGRRQRGRVGAGRQQADLLRQEPADVGIHGQRCSATQTEEVSVERVELVVVERRGERVERMEGAAPEHRGAVHLERRVSAAGPPRRIPGTLGYNSDTRPDRGRGCRGHGARAREREGSAGGFAVAVPFTVTEAVSDVRHHVLEHRIVVHERLRQRHTHSALERLREFHRRHAVEALLQDGRRLVDGLAGRLVEDPSQHLCDVHFPRECRSGYSVWNRCLDGGGQEDRLVHLGDHLGGSAAERPHRQAPLEVPEALRRRQA